MISSEPIISIGIIESAKEVRGIFNGQYELTNSVKLRSAFRIANNQGLLVLYDEEGVEVIRSAEICCRALNNATFTLNNVAIGINFHWERKEDQTFEGDLRLLPNVKGTITAINETGIESYLKSVISSEMNSEAPIELLKAHAITSRSWLAAMLERQKKFQENGLPPKRSIETEDEIIRWYDREDHKNYNVCADDHCQRYHGITKVVSKSAGQAVDATTGKFLIYDGQICDARFSKVCGGRTELFENCWEDTRVPYLQSISDSVSAHPNIKNESEAEHWILELPEAYCNTADGNILRQVLPSFDRETTDFFRWKVEYSREQLEEILKIKSGIDFGTVTDIVPIQRGESGRINKLKIIGSKRTIIVGKELEIRRWLSKSHLYSSAFIVKTKRDTNDIPTQFAFHGAGWGHGVGLCQIGAAVMAAKGSTAEKIVAHYFRGTELKKLY